MPRKVVIVEEGCAWSGCLIEEEDELWISIRLEEDAELFAEESIDLYSSSILFNKIPFDNPSIFLLRISTCTVLEN